MVCLMGKMTVKDNDLKRDQMKVEAVLATVELQLQTIRDLRAASKSTCKLKLKQIEVHFAYTRDRLKELNKMYGKKL